MKRFSVMIDIGDPRGTEYIRMEGRYRDEIHCREIVAAWLGATLALRAIIRENPETLEGAVSNLLRRQVQ